MPCFDDQSTEPPLLLSHPNVSVPWEDVAAVEAIQEQLRAHKNQTGFGNDAIAADLANVAASSDFNVENLRTLMRKDTAEQLAVSSGRGAHIEGIAAIKRYLNLAADSSEDDSTCSTRPSQGTAKRGKASNLLCARCAGQTWGKHSNIIGSCRRALLGCVVRMAFPGRRTYAGMIVHTFWCTVEEEHCYRVVFDDLDMGDYTKTEVVGSLLPEDEGRALKRTSLR